MTRRYYNAKTLAAELREFEKFYGLSSAEFAELHRRGEDPERVSDFDRVVWADTYREHLRLLEDQQMTTTVSVVAALILFLVGVGFGLLCGLSPYSAASLVVGGALWLAWQTAKKVRR